MTQSEKIQARIERVLVDNKPNKDDPFEVLLHRRLIEVARHIYYGDAAVTPDVCATEKGIDALNGPVGLEPDQLACLQQIVDDELAFYDEGSCHWDTLVNEHHARSQHRPHNARTTRPRNT
jgi:hypothetical protein